MTSRDKSKLITKGAEIAREHGHKIGEVQTYRGGAFGKCTVCGRHLRIETSRPTIFGSVTWKPCQ